MSPHPFSWMGPLALPRLILLLNHVVSSEALAAAKLQAHAGRTIDIRWTLAHPPALPAFLGAWASAEAWTPPPLRLIITPAGLFESAADTGMTEADRAAPSNMAGMNGLSGLVLTVTLPDPLSFARMALKGSRPDVQIEGDAALAEVASWLMNNLRWDIQDDLARWLGDTQAEWLRQVGEGLRQSLQRWRPGPASRSATR